jgi:hypothetical protein
VLAGNTPVLVHNEGGDDYNQAMNKALEWLDERGSLPSGQQLESSAPLLDSRSVCRQLMVRPDSALSLMIEMALTLTFGVAKKREHTSTLMRVSGPSRKSKASSGVNDD